MEEGFSGLPFPVVFVRAGGFYENFLYGLQAAQSGALPVFYDPTDRKSPMVASEDVGAELAKLLTGPAWTATRVIELGSMVSPDEVAAQLVRCSNARSRRSHCHAMPGPKRSSGWVFRMARPGLRGDVRSSELRVDQLRGSGHGA